MQSNSAVLALQIAVKDFCGERQQRGLFYGRPGQREGHDRLSCVQYVTAAHRKVLEVMARCVESDGFAESLAQAAGVQDESMYFTPRVVVSQAHYCRLAVSLNGFSVEVRFEETADHGMSGHRHSRFSCAFSPDYDPAQERYRLGLSKLGLSYEYQSSRASGGLLWYEARFGRLKGYLGQLMPLQVMTNCDGRTGRERRPVAFLGFPMGSRSGAAYNWAIGFKEDVQNGRGKAPHFLAKDIRVCGRQARQR